LSPMVQPLSPSVNTISQQATSLQIAELGV
jgi:hypothetical protein